MFWVSCQLRVACLSTCCLFFPVFNWTTERFRKQSGRCLVTLLCSVYFCDDIFIYHTCTVRECAPMSLVQSDNSLSPFPFTLANSVFLSCCRIVLRDRTLTCTANNPAVLLMLYNSMKQSAKQGCEQYYLNLPPDRYNFLWNREIRHKVGMILQNFVLSNSSSLVLEVAEPSATFVDFSGSQNAHHLLKQCTCSQN